MCSLYFPSITSVITTGSRTHASSHTTNTLLKALGKIKTYTADLLVKAGSTRSINYTTSLDLKKLGATKTHSTDISITGGTSGLLFDYFLHIEMENTSYYDVIGDTGNAPDINNMISGSYTLGNGASSANRWFYSQSSFSGSSINPSLPNYIDQTSGNFTDNGGSLIGNDRSINGNFISHGNIIDSLESGSITWKVYMEGYPGNGWVSGDSTDSFGDDYIEHHDPFMYYTNVGTNSTRFANVVTANTNNSILFSDNTVGPNVLINDLNATGSNGQLTAAQYMWLSPCNDHNMHDAGILGNSNATGNLYLSTIMPLILSSKVATTKKLAIFVIWDEGNDSSNDRIPNFFMSTTGSTGVIKNGYAVTGSYQHASEIKTLEYNWNLQALPSSTTNTLYKNSYPILEIFKGH